MLLVYILLLLLLLSVEMVEVGIILSHLPEFLKLIFNSLTRLGNFEMKNKSPALQVYYCKIFTQSLTRHLVLIGREIVNF